MVNCEQGFVKALLKARKLVNQIPPPPMQSLPATSTQVPSSQTTTIRSNHHLSFLTLQHYHQ